MTSVGVIYGLTCVCHPEQGIRYVGQTQRTPAVRLRAHLYDAKRGRVTGVCGWIRKHGAENVRMITLEECAVSDLNARERHWIQTLGDAGLWLHNLTPGGDSSPRFSDDEMSRIRAMYGSGMTQAQVAHKWGVAQTTISSIVRDLAPAGIGRSKSGSSQPGESNSMAKLTWSDVIDIRASHTSGKSIRSIADRLGCEYRHIWMIVKRKIWASGSIQEGASDGTLAA